MRVVALVSGGKDSCYSMQLCKQYGHDVVALANLLPEESAPDELDSFCFQTVGHQLIGAYAACMGVPLFRKRISGTSQVQDLGYSPTEGDEVEDLYQLLAYVKENVSGIQAVASGAIASDYQRLRVENVCSRLNLVSLAYLWHQPQRLLLRAMVESGVEAILVKVACLGLHPRKHLGRSIAALEPLLLSLADAYGCNVCGEGGEYETLTLDCPMFTRGTIELDEFEIVLGTSDVGHLVPKTFRVVPKLGWEGCELPAEIRIVPGDYVAAPRASSRCSTSLAPAPAAAAASGAGAIATAAGGSAAAASAAAAFSAALDPLPLLLLQPAAPASFCVHVSVCSGPDYVQLVCRAVRPRSALPADLTECDTTAALHALLETAEQELASQHMDLQHCLFVHLFLANMGHFQAANGVYCKHFPSRDPPSRACVQVCLPHDCPVMCEFLLARGAARPAAGPAGQQLSPLPQPQASSPSAPAPSALSAVAVPPPPPAAPLPPPPPPLPPPVVVTRHARRVLHVQSISSWAPSCIGPYSQATSYRGLVYLAGMIPLDPPVMTLVPGDITAQVLRAMLSCEAVAVAQRTTVVGAALGLTVYLAASVGGGGGGSGVAAPSSGGGGGGGGAVERGCASGGGAELRALTQAAVEAILEHGLPGYPHVQHRQGGGAVGSPSIGSAGPGGGGSGGFWGARFHRSSTCESDSGVAPPRCAHGAWPGGGGVGRVSAPSSRRAVLLGADGLDEEEEEAAAAAADAAVCGGEALFAGRGATGGHVYGAPPAAVLDPYLQPPEVRVPVRPSVLYVSVPSLPRSSLVEIQPVCLDVEALAVIRKLTGHDSFGKRRNSSHHDAASLHAFAGQHHPNINNSNAAENAHITGGGGGGAHGARPPPAYGSPSGGGAATAAVTSWSELPPTPRASMESLAGREDGGGAGAAGSQNNNSVNHNHSHNHHGLSPVHWQVSAETLAMGALASPLPSHLLSAAGFMSPEAGGSLVGTPSAGQPTLARNRSSAGMAFLANGGGGGSSGGGLAFLGTLGGGGGSSGSGSGGGYFPRCLSPGPAAVAPLAGGLPPGLATGLAAPPSAFGTAAVGGKVPQGLQLPPHPPLSAQSSGHQLLSPTLQHLLQLQLSPQQFLQPIQHAIAETQQQQLLQLQQQQLQWQQQQPGQQPLARSATAGSGGPAGMWRQGLTGSNGGAGPGKELLTAGQAPPRTSYSGTGSSAGASGCSSGPLAQRSSLDGNILSFEVSNGRGGPPLLLPLQPHPMPHGAMAVAAVPTEVAVGAPSGEPVSGHLPVVCVRPASIAVPKPSVVGGMVAGNGGIGGSAAMLPQRSPFVDAVNTAAGVAAAGVSAAEFMPPAEAVLLTTGDAPPLLCASTKAALTAVAAPPPPPNSRWPAPHPPTLTIPAQDSSSGSETTPTTAGGSGPTVSEHPAAAGAGDATANAIRSNAGVGAAAGAGRVGSSSSDVMVTTVCCYGQVLRSLFHLPPAVFAPGVTTAQLTRRFRRAAASVLAAHGMDMSCLIWARVWYEKGSVEFTDDEYGSGASAAPPSAVAPAVAGPGPRTASSFTAPAGLGGGRPRVLHALEDDLDGADGGGNSAVRQRRSPRRASGSGESSSCGGVIVSAAAVLGTGGCDSPRPSAAVGATTAAASAEVAAAGGDSGSPRCLGSSVGAVASPPAHPHHRYLSGLQPTDASALPPEGRLDQQSHHHHHYNVGLGHSHSFTPHHQQHHHHHQGKDSAAHGQHPHVNIHPHSRSHAHAHTQLQPQHHFHVSWIPVQRVATNASPQPQQCVAVLELLAALPTP